MAPTTAMKMDPREAELQRQIAIAKNVLRSEAKVLEALSKK
jgi:tartrate dehydratase beta subunit/fumarate hydratase class I family protein